MCALLLNMHTTNVGELLLGSPFGGCGSKLSGWTQRSTPIAPRQALFGRHGSLQISGLRPFSLIQEITNEFRSTQSFCPGEQVDWIVSGTGMILGCCFSPLLVTLPLFTP